MSDEANPESSATSSTDNSTETASTRTSTSIADPTDTASTRPSTPAPTAAPKAKFKGKQKQTGALSDVEDFDEDDVLAFQAEKKQLFVLFKYLLTDGLCSLFFFRTNELRRDRIMPAGPSGLGPADKPPAVKGQLNPGAIALLCGTSQPPFPHTPVPQPLVCRPTPTLILIPTLAISAI